MIAAVLFPLPHFSDDKITISEQIDAVMNEAARLGVPVLAVASTDSCSEGPVLKRQLAGNPAVQPLVTRFAIVEPRMSGDSKWEWHRWQDRFNTHRRNTPEAAPAATKRLAEISRDPEGKETVRQAQLLHRAAVAARRSPDRGLALYQQIIAMHPDSPATELARLRLGKIDCGSH